MTPVAPSLAGSPAPRRDRGLRAWWKRALCLGLLVAFLFPPGRSVAGEMTSLAETHWLGYWDMRYRNPLRVEGVVTLVDAHQNRLVLEDAAGAVAFVFKELPQGITVGEHVVLSATDSKPYLPIAPDYPQKPSLKSSLGAFETPSNWAEQYVDRVSGYIHPPRTGTYRFFITSDFNAELWLSTDDSSEKSERVARCDSFTKPRDWLLAPYQASAPVQLEAGKRYYVSAVHEQDGGESHMSVGWEGPEITRQVIPGVYLSPREAEQPETRDNAAPSARGSITWEAWRGLYVDGVWKLTVGRKYFSVLMPFNPTVVSKGRSPLPAEKNLALEHVMTPGQNFRWSQVEGVVDFVSKVDGQLVLELVDADKRVSVHLKSWGDLKPERLRHHRVQVRGVAESSLNAADELVFTMLWTPSSEHLRIIDSELKSGDYHSATITDFLSGDFTAPPNKAVRLSGIVVSRDGPQALTLRDNGSFEAFVSQDGVKWRQLGTAIDLPMTESILVGLAINSNSGTELSTATIDRVSGLSSSPLEKRMGIPPAEGEARIADGVFELKGSGHQIWNSNDQFFFVYEGLKGEGEISARIIKTTTPDNEAKVGLMMREGLSENDQFIDLVLTENEGASFQWRRRVEGLTPKHVSDYGVHFPCWFKLKRRYSTVSVAANDASRFAAGQAIEVLGYPAMKGDARSLVDASCRTLSLEPAPKEITALAKGYVEIADVGRGAKAGGTLDVFKVRGLVTFSGDVMGRHYIAMQDKSGGVLVQRSLDLIQQSPEAGQWIEVHSNPGWRRPGQPSGDLVADQILTIGPGVEPAPLRHPLEYLLPKKGEGSWVESEGIVRAVSPEGFLQVKDKGETFSVFIGGAQADSLAGLVDHAVRIRGAITYPSERERLLLVPSLKHLEVTETPAQDPWLLPLQPLASLQPVMLINQSLHRTHITGRVTLVEADYLFIQDGNTGAKIEVHAETSIQLGDEIDAIGFPDYSDDRILNLSAATIRKLGPGAPLIPSTVTSEPLQSGRFDGRLVRITGAMAPLRPDASERNAIQLETGTGIVRASLSRGATLSALPPTGSLVELTGVCTSTGKSNAWTQATPQILSGVVPHLLLRTADDFVVLQKPRWWVVRRTLLVSGALGLVLLVISGWIHMLRRRVALRTIELENTMERLKQETQTAATLSERNRLAGEIHDSLEQGFSGLLLQLDTTAKLAACPPEIRAGLGLARNMVAFSRAEVQHAVWDLQSPLLKHASLAAALESMIGQLSPEKPKISLSVEGTAHRLPSATEHHLLRIAQESITNAIKHADATRIDVLLAYDKTRVRLTVGDDGHGFVPSQVLTGGLGHFGLRSLRGRAKKIGGEMNIQSAPGSGTVVSLEVPVQVV